MPSPLSRIDAFLGCPSGSCRQPPSVPCAGDTLWGSAPHDSPLHSPGSGLGAALHPSSECPPTTLALPHVSPSHTDQDLHCEQSLSSVTGVNGEFDGEAGRDPSRTQPRAARPHLAGIVGGQRRHLEGAGGQKESGGCWDLQVVWGSSSAHPRWGLTCAAPLAPRT